MIMNTELVLSLLLGFFGGFVFAVLLLMAFVSRMIKSATITKTEKGE